MLEAMPAKKDIVVVGASAGGMEALRELVSGLPADLGASIFVVWHMPAEATGILPALLAKDGPLPAAHAVDGEAIEPGRIYVARPDHHLLLEPGVVRVTRGPKENRFRPAVDPLFRSAAYAYGSRVIGVVLSGALDDGTAGLWTIKQRGGTAVVQDPEDAIHRSMPRSALQNVAVDHQVPVRAMAALLARLVREPASPAKELPMEEQKKIEMEVRTASGDPRFERNNILEAGPLSPFTCPECHGVLAQLQEGSITRYRCHTGHAYSAPTLLASLNDSVEDRLWDAARVLDETAMLLKHIGEHHEQAGEEEMAGAYYGRANEALERGKSIRSSAMTSPILDTAK